MILFDPGSSDLTPHLSQLPTKIVTRQWTYPLSLHCRNAISFMRLVTRPCLQISQMVGWSSAAIALSPSASPKPGHCDRVFAIDPQRLDRNRSVVIELGQSQTAPTPGQEAPCPAPSERQAGAAWHGPDGEILTAKATNFAADQNPGRP